MSQSKYPTFTKCRVFKAEDIYSSESLANLQKSNYEVIDFRAVHIGDIVLGAACSEFVSIATMNGHEDNPRLILKEIKLYKVSLTEKELKATKVYVNAFGSDPIRQKIYDKLDIAFTTQ